MKNSNNCDSSYPDFCIKPPPPDLNCDDIPGNDFRVLSPDPHELDRNGDGIGCESEMQP
jgi:micrococcal nuclease